MIDTLRQEGLARCSRPFPLAGGGVRLVTMQLGPGFVRGDRFEAAGSVGAGADLTITPQAATRALGAGAESVSRATWHVGAGGTLRLLGEPLVIYEGAHHRATVDVELAAGATLAYVDVVAARGTFVRIRTRLRVRAAEGLLLSDAIALTPESLTGAVGSGFFMRAGLSQAANRRALAAADAAAVDASAAYGVRIGVGTPAHGGISVRALGAPAPAVQAAVYDVLARAVHAAP